jgi:hypothetical protein
MAFKRRTEPTTVEDEREALLAQHAALEELKRELVERVDAVRGRELELHHALAEVGGPRPGAATPPAPALADAEADTGEDALEAERRELQLVEREQALVAREQELMVREQELERRAVEIAGLPPADPDAARLEQIEARLAELRDAEKLFLRTRDELAPRSEAVAARERLVAQRERELDDREDGKGQWAGRELSEMEARLRRLEQHQPGEQTLGFSGGLRKLEQGTRPQRGS